MVEEAERSLHDALSVLSQTVKETRVTLGGGCAEMLMSCAVDEAARTVKGKKALAVEGFARALRQVSQTLRISTPETDGCRYPLYLQTTVDTIPQT
jgi:T-complex protein 1 subunit beta